MPHYLCFLVDAAGDVAASRFIHCADDGAARASADELLGVAGYGAIEVWDGERKVYSMRKRGAARARQAPRRGAR